MRFARKGKSGVLPGEKRKFSGGEARELRERIASPAKKLRVGGQVGLGIQYQEA